MLSKKEVDGKDSWRIFRIMSEFVEGFEVLAKLDKAVSVFGSARTKPHDPFYRAAHETSRLLAKQGYAIITGGGPGIMEAGNKGAFDAGGESVGLNISLPHEQESNSYQTVSLDFHYFYARKVMFVKYADAFICFPGGFGTLDEFAEVLTLIQTLKIEPFPVILYGSRFWTGLVDWMKQQLVPSFIDPEDVEIFRIVDTPADAVKMVTRGVKNPWWSPEDDPSKLVSPRKKASTPLVGSESESTGEGTRYGKRPRVSPRKHIKPSPKPQQ